jgi:gas vesicle protein
MKMTIGLAVGIAVGVCIGLLIAPERGSDTRRKLADSAGDWMDKVKNFFSRAEEESAASTASKKSKQTPRPTQ